MNLRAACAGAALAATVWFPVAAEAAPANEYELESAGSSLTFTAVQQGAKFDSRFERFTAKVRFDPARPESGSISARIDLGSVDTGNPERDEVLAGADWFNLGRWPEAVFTASQVVRDGGGYRASGYLELRGVRAPVTLNFTWSEAMGGRPARLQGAARVRRLDFGVGAGEWQDTSYVGDEVSIRVDIRLNPAESAVAR